MYDIVEEIDRLSGVRIPDAYFGMWKAGVFQHGHEQFIEFTDTHWLTLDEILSRTVQSRRIRGLVPFALTGRGDWWAWYRGWHTDRGTAVLYCPHDLNVGEGYAPDFIGCVYRLLLEEFSSSWLVGRIADRPEDLLPLFQRYSSIAASFLPAPWSRVLVGMSRGPVVEIEPHIYGVVTREEADAIIRSDLDFHGLNKELRIEP